MELLSFGEEIGSMINRSRNPEFIMSLGGIQYVGSFQKSKIRFPSENPLEEVWVRVSQHGTAEFVRKLTPTTTVSKWDELVDYAVVRIRQAVELRNAARRASLLTSPLMFYYSFLNLTRGMLAIGPEIMPAKGHGLRYISAKQLLDCAAEITPGTFSDFLSSQRIVDRNGVVITLNEP